MQKYGLIWTSIFGRDEAKANFPVLDTWEMPDHQAILPPFVDIAGSSGRQLEGFIDVAHFAWVHQGSFADPENQVCTQIHDRTYRLRPAYRKYVSSVSNYRHGMQDLGTGRLFVETCI